MPYKSKEDYQKAWARHYAKNRDYYLQRNKKRKQEMLEFVNQLKNVPCMDCGHSFPPHVMDFDHRGEEEKVGNVATLIRRAGMSKKRILAEIAKCDIVCSNCHRIRTYAKLHSGVV